MLNPNKSKRTSLLVNGDLLFLRYCLRDSMLMMMMSFPSLQFFNSGLLIAAAAQVNKLILIDDDEGQLINNVAI
jgi:hypothetical protein